MQLIVKSALLSMLLLVAGATPSHAGTILTSPAASFEESTPSHPSGDHLPAYHFDEEYENESKEMEKDAGAVRVTPTPVLYAIALPAIKNANNRMATHRFGKIPIV